VAPQTQTALRTSISTSDRATLASLVVHRAPEGVTVIGIAFTRSVVDFLTGSNMVTTRRFAPDAKDKFYAYERSAIQSIIDILLEALSDPEVPYGVDVVDSDRLQRVHQLIAELDAQFDEKGCKHLLYGLLDSDYASFYMVDPYIGQNVDAAIAYLTNAEIGQMERFPNVLDNLGEGQSDHVDQLKLISSTMKQCYPGAADPIREAYLDYKLFMHDQSYPFVLDASQVHFS